MLNIKIYKNKKGDLRLSMHANIEDLKELKNALSSKSVSANPIGNIMPLIMALRNIK